MPPKSIPIPPPAAADSPRKIPGESNSTSTPASNNVDQTVRSSSAPGEAPGNLLNSGRVPMAQVVSPALASPAVLTPPILSPPSYTTVTPQLTINETGKIQLQREESRDQKDVKKTERKEERTEQHKEETITRETRSSESSITTITKSLEIKERLSGFELSGGILYVQVKNEAGVLVKREINLDGYLGFAQDGTLSWEAEVKGFSSVKGATISIQGSRIIAVYKERKSYIDLYEKIRVFNGELTILSFSTRMFSQVPWMNFRVLAYPTMNAEIEAMITRSTASIASSTVRTASTKLQREISQLIETTISSVHEEINQRVQLEVECLRESMQVTMQQQMFATMQASLAGPVDWDSLRQGFEGGNGHLELHPPIFKDQVLAYPNGGNGVKA